MPQFEITPYLSQAFWMLVSFGWLYFFMAGVVFPALGSVFARRRELIDGALEKAAATNSKAEELMASYEDFIATAEREKADIVQKAYDEIQRAAEETEAQNDQNLHLKIQKSEGKIKKIKEELAQHSDEIAAQIALRFVDKFYQNRTILNKKPVGRTKRDA
ncbi:MAG: hypothetical protein LBU87_06495 [Lactobacillales bacterium]|jgi:F-type H+-transporting ATPase subunit b|nr:hypothetical protein [Lactobacillales bacterium]